MSKDSKWSREIEINLGLEIQSFDFFTLFTRILTAVFSSYSGWFWDRRLSPECWVPSQNVWSPQLPSLSGTQPMLFRTKDRLSWKAGHDHNLTVRPPQPGQILHLLCSPETICLPEPTAVLWRRERKGSPADWTADRSSFSWAQGRGGLGSVQELMSLLTCLTHERLITVRIISYPGFSYVLPI